MLFTWDMHLLSWLLAGLKAKSKRLGNQKCFSSNWLPEARWCPRSAHHRSLMHFNQSKCWRVSKDIRCWKDNHAVLSPYHWQKKKFWRETERRSYYCSGNSKVPAETIGSEEPYIKFGTTIVRLPVQECYSVHGLPKAFWLLRGTERSRQWTDNLGNQSVQIGVGRTLNMTCKQVPATNIVKSFVVVHDGHIGVLQQWMHAQDLNEQMYAILADMCFHIPKHFFCLSIYELSTYPFIYLSICSYSMMVTCYDQKLHLFSHTSPWIPMLFQNLKKMVASGANRLFTNEVPYCKVVEVCEKCRLL